MSVAAVPNLIPGGSHHEPYKAILQTVASFAGSDRIVLKPLKAEKVRLAYVLVWRNDARSATHFYAPSPSQASVPDFIRFYNDPYTLFETDLPRLYRRKKLFFF